MTDEKNQGPLHCAFCTGPIVGAYRAYKDEAFHKQGPCAMAYLERMRMVRGPELTLAHPTPEVVAPWPPPTDRVYLHNDPAVAEHRFRVTEVHSSYAMVEEWAPTHGHLGETAVERSRFWALYRASGDHKFPAKPAESQSKLQATLGPRETARLMGGTLVAGVPGVKADQGKLRFDLFPPEAEEEIVQALTHGAAKYTDEGWREVPNGRSRYFAALRRHLNAWRRGERMDQDSGLPHLACAGACLVFLLELDRAEKDAPPA